MKNSYVAYYIRPNGNRKLIATAWTKAKCTLQIQRYRQLNRMDAEELKSFNDTVESVTRKRWNEMNK